MHKLKYCKSKFSNFWCVNQLNLIKKAYFVNVINYTSRLWFTSQLRFNKTQSKLDYGFK